MTERLKPSPDIYERYPELKEIPRDKFPQSVFLIPDGNGRWAKAHNQQITEGHEKGGLVLKGILVPFVELPTRDLGIWPFSHDNWKRPKEEIDGIMTVIPKTIMASRDFLHQHQIRVIRLGRENFIQEGYPDLWQIVNQIAQETQDYEGKRLILPLDFSGKDQTLRMLERYSQLPPGTPVTMELLESLRDGGGLIKPFDLVIRTGGERHVSDLGWLAENSEYYTIEHFLPDMQEEDLVAAIVYYSQRERRFGGRPETK